MKKTLLIVIVCLLVVAGVLGIYYFQTKKPVTKINQNVPVNSEQTVTDQPTADQLPQPPAVDNKTNEALNSASSSACEQLENEADKISCRQSYIIRDAAVSGDLNKCKELTEAALIENCNTQALFSLAIQKKDDSYCKKIVDKTSKEECLKIIEQIAPAEKK